jgi:Fe2+ transport system protein FeoA
MSTLYDLNINSTAKIHSLHTVNESTLRLSQMGLVSGSTVRMIKKNPFGGPLELKLNDYYLAIRKEDAKMIYIQDK